LLDTLLQEKTAPLFWFHGAQFWQNEQQIRIDCQT